MSITKLVANQLSKAKKDIRTRYIAGESVPSIGDSYGVSVRNIYYHLGDITPDEKALHVKNSILRKMAVQRKEEQEHGKETNSQSAGQTSPSSLADFVEPKGKI